MPHKVSSLGCGVKNACAVTAKYQAFCDQHSNGAAARREGHFISYYMPRGSDNSRTGHCRCGYADYEVSLGVLLQCQSCSTMQHSLCGEKPFESRQVLKNWTWASCNDVCGICSVSLTTSQQNAVRDANCSRCDRTFHSKCMKAKRWKLARPMKANGIALV